MSEDIKKPGSTELASFPDDDEKSASTSDYAVKDEEPSGISAEKTPDIPSAAQDTPEAEFKPFYKKEARRSASLNFGLFVVLIVLGLSLLGAAVSTFVFDAPFKLETATITVICFAVIGLLWKKMSLQVKTGLAAFALGLQAAVAYTVYAGNLSWPPFLPGWMFLPALLCLMVAATLLAVWLLWPQIHWLPIALTVIILYGALAAVLPFIQGQGTTQAVFTGPGFMAGWPWFIRSGYFLAQVILPLGIILFLILQARTLFRPQYASHWGFIFWALCLAAVWTVGLSALERADEPVFPRVTPLAAKIHVPETPAPAETASTSTPAASPAEPPAAPSESVTEPAPPAPEVETTPAPEATTPAEPTEPKTAETPPVTSEPQAESPSPFPSGEQPAPESEPSAETLELQKRVRVLEDEINDLYQRIDAQERLIRALLDVFGSQGDRFGPEQEDPMSPSDEFHLPSPESPLFPQDWQDYT